jgi:hypothetical protein
MSWLVREMPIDLIQQLPTVKHADRSQVVGDALSEVDAIHDRLTGPLRTLGQLFNHSVCAAESHNQPLGRGEPDGITA